MHRLECVPCSNRIFSNREALQQHLKTSSLWHPACSECDKRFSSLSGLEAHTTAKHPPTFDCDLCDRKFGQSFALDDHYRGSPNHPNCLRCGKGFRDENELSTHLSSAHPKVRCIPCNDVVYEDQDSLQQHYTLSAVHPKCTVCSRGCRDEAERDEHMRTSHDLERDSPPSGGSASPIQRTMGPTPSPPTSISSKFPLQENVSPVAIRNPGSALAGSSIVHSHSFTSSSEWHSTPLLQTAPLISSESPAPPYFQVARAHPTPGFNPSYERSDGFSQDKLAPWNPKTAAIKDIASLGRRSVDTPPLRLATAFASPLMNVQAPSFSPLSGLMPPGQEADRVWATKENRQIASGSQGPTQPSYQTAPEWRRKPRSPTTLSSTSSSATRPLPGTSESSSSSIPTLSYLQRTDINTTKSLSESPITASKRPESPTSRSVASSAGARFVGAHTPRESPYGPSSSLLPRRLSPPFTFSPRLYPGSARQALRESATEPGSKTDSPLLSHSPPTAQTTVGRVLQRNGGSLDILSWKSLIGEEGPAGFVANTEMDTPRAPSPPPAGNDKSTDAPVIRDNAMGLGGIIKISSPSTPGSTSRNVEPEEANSDEAGKTVSPPAGPTNITASDPGHLQAPDLIFSTSAASSFLHSPEVSSPFDLQRLPSLSPLQHTPVDMDLSFTTFLDNVTVPEAQHPLPESPIIDQFDNPEQRNDMDRNCDHGLSLTVPIAMDLNGVSTFSSPGSGSGSYRTTPQDPIIGSEPTSAVAAPPSSLPSPSPRQEGDHRVLSGDGATAALTTSESSELSRDGHESDDVPQTVATSVTSLPSALSPLHCRFCKRDTCEDITATMCGHIFCYKCITTAVINTSKCPVCSTPTLLYCLFKLDLSA